MVNIIDVGVGNTTSLTQWLLRNKIRSEKIVGPDQYRSGPILLPGVACSAHLMRCLSASGFDDLLRQVANLGELIVGICAGFQVLGVSTSESGGASCLGLLPYETQRLPIQDGRGINGWFQVDLRVEDFPAGVRRNFGSRKKVAGTAYFNHEYGAVPTDCSIGINPRWVSEDQGGALKYFAEANIFGFQFHPEKSARYGSLIAEALR